MIGLDLLVLAVVVAVVALRGLPSAAWVYRAPRLGMAAWYACLITVAASVAIAVAATLLHVGSRLPVVCSAVVWCVEAMSGQYGTVIGTPVHLVAVLVALVGLRAVIRTAQGARAMGRRRRDHAEMLIVAGRPDATLGVTVIQHPQPAAYVLAGRSCRVVVTSGALDHLTAAELTAVLAHERAHAAGHHQVLLDVLRLAAQALPRLAVVRAAHEQIARLVEIRADEVACSGHSRLDLARALVTMATPYRGQSPTPGAAMAATGGDTAERLRRLLAPPRPLPRAYGAILSGFFAALPAGPFLLVAACGWWAPLSACLWTR